MLSWPLTFHAPPQLHAVHHAHTWSPSNSPLQLLPGAYIELGDTVIEAVSMEECMMAAAVAQRAEASATAGGALAGTSCLPGASSLPPPPALTSPV